MIQQTSLSAYLDVLQDLGKRQYQVYQACLRLQPCSNSEISFWLGWSINRVTPRVKELRSNGMIVCAGKRQCKITGKNVLTWKTI